ncbi:MAG: hypothetical protein KGJ57_10800 [Sphingomonadales bacterium]|nr:hypothetical protein [Sphingomonadales bacterium]MDE2169901.1 hypothetical protein [Sphingomonadales bacterium]
MRFHRHTAALIAATMLVPALPAMAQDTAASHAQSSRVTRTTIPGHVSVNKTRVVHVKKHVTTPAKHRPTGSVHTTTSRVVHTSSAHSGGEMH